MVNKLQSHLICLLTSLEEKENVLIHILMRLSEFLYVYVLSCYSRL